MTDSHIHLINCNFDAHAEAIVAIFNHEITHTTALYDYKPRDLNTMKTWFDIKQASGFPVIGAINNDKVLMGFASYGAFRPWAGYKYSVEHSVYVHQDFRHRGIARLLMETLVERAQQQDYHIMVGVIDCDNKASIALHEKLGFHHAGTLQQAGYKFGRWLDVAFYQRLFTTPLSPTEAD